MHRQCGNHHASCWYVLKERSKAVKKIMIVTWSNLKTDLQYNQLVESLMNLTKDRSSISAARLALCDSVVDSAVNRQIGRTPLPDIVTSIWSESLNAAIEFAHEWINSSNRNLIFLVSETKPLEDKDHIGNDGERVYGFCQIAFLQRPDRLTREKWRSIWQDSHTQIAIETQSTFAYRQNVIEKCYGDEGWNLDAIVEENFPPEAMSSDLAFYDAQDEIQLSERQEAMMASCARFIDFDRIDVVPMSEYVVKNF